MTKKEIRRKYIELRMQLTPQDVDQKSLAIANKLLALHIWNKEVYHTFLPIIEKREVNTEFLLHILSGKDKKVVVSRSAFDTGKMHHIILEESTSVVKNTYGIPEPVNGEEVSPDVIDVVFVPLLAFDEEGHRVGYGKGFYDRFLADCHVDVIKVGLSFFESESKIAEIFDSDIRLDYCVTPEKVYIFSRERS